MTRPKSSLAVDKKKLSFVNEEEVNLGQVVVNTRVNECVSSWSFDVLDIVKEISLKWLHWTLGYLLLYTLGEKDIIVRDVLFFFYHRSRQQIR